MSYFKEHLSNDFEFMEDIWINYPETKEVRETLANWQWDRLYQGFSNEIPYENKLKELLSLLDMFSKESKENQELSTHIIRKFFKNLKRNIEDGKFPANLDFKDNLDHEIKDTEKKLEHLDQDRVKQIYKKWNSIKRFSNFRNDIKNEEEEKIYGLSQKIRILKKLKQRQKIHEYELNTEEIDDIRELIQKKSHWNKFLNEFEEDFLNQYEQIETFKELFGDLSEFSNYGWDLAQGIFSKKKRIKLIEIKRFMEEKKEIHDFMEKVGKSILEEFEEYNSREKSKRLSYIKDHELLSFETSSDLSRTLPNELALLSNPHLKKVFYSKYLESRLNSYSLKNLDDKNNKREEDKLGPIIMCIDTSSSMKGLPEKISKGVAISIYNIAMREKRDVYIMIFGSYKEIKTIDLSGDNKIQKLLEFLNSNFHGGTDFITPLKEGIKLIRGNRFKNADILLITDGLAILPKKDLNDLLLAKKKESFKIYSLIVGNIIEEDKFSDLIFNYNS